jgi:hypothetical protein
MKTGQPLGAGQNVYPPLRKISHFILPSGRIYHHGTTSLIVIDRVEKQIKDTL